MTEEPGFTIVDPLVVIIPSTIKNYLTMNHFQIVHSTKDTEKGHFAITHYRTIKYKNKRSLVEVNIDTG